MYFPDRDQDSAMFAIFKKAKITAQSREQWGSITWEKPNLRAKLLSLKKKINVLVFPPLCTQHNEDAKLYIN